MMRMIVSSQALTPWYGGSAISEASLCAHLNRYGEVTVLCRKGALDYSFVRSFGVKEVREFEPNDAFEAWKSDSHWLSQYFNGADIFHLNGHWKWENYFLARLCQRKNIPYILHPRGMLLVGHRRVAMKRAFNFVIGKWIVRHAARVIALSHFEVTQFAPYGVDPGRIVVLPNGIAVPELIGSSVFPRDMKVDGAFFLYLGRLEERKNLLFLVDAFAEYRRKGGTASLLLVGPVERDYDKRIEERARRCQIEKRVKVLPPLYGHEKWVYMENARAVIYPSVDEPFGRVPFEAIAAGAYPIIPSASGSAEYLSPLLPECIYRSQDPTSLVRVMTEIERKCVTNDRASLEKARAWVKQTLDWEKVAETVHGIYEQVLGERKTQSSAAAR